MRQDVDRWYPPDLYLHPNELALYANPRNPPLEERKLNNIRSAPGGGIQRPVQLNTDGIHAQLDDGHHRLYVALEAGLETVPVSLFPVGSWFFDDVPIPVAVSAGLGSHLQERRSQGDSWR